MAEQRMLEKLSHNLTEDVEPLLPAGLRYTAKDAVTAFNNVWGALIVKLKGDPWKLTEKTVDEVRQNGFPTLLQ